MSTANKLTYLNVTKQKLKQAINNIGGEVTDETTFRQYANQLQNVYDNLPKTEYQEGTDITIENGLKGKLDFEDGIVGIGDTKQETTTGINMCECKMPTSEASGITLTNNNDGTYTISGTNTNNSITSFRINQSTRTGGDNLQSYDSGSYTLDVGITNENIRFSLMQNVTWTEYLPTGYGTRIKSGTLSAIQNIFMLIQIKAGASFTTPVTIKPMLVSGSYTTSTMPTFEKFTGNSPSPSPSYPQDIEVVRGKNLAHIEAEGKYRSSASGNFSINANYNGYIAKVSQNTTYSGSFTNMASNYNDVSNLCYFDKNMNFISGNSYNTANKTFTTPSNCAYVTMAVKTNIVDFQLEKGSQATSYLPYNTLKVVGRGKNLFVPTLKNLEDDTISLHKHDISSVTLNNDEYTFVASGTDLYFGAAVGTGSSYSPGSGNKIYVGNATKMSYRITNSDFNKCHFSAFNSSNISLGYTGITGNTGTYTIPSGTSYVVVRFGKNDAVSGTTYKTKVMVAYGDTIPDYEPYQTPQTYQLSLGEYEFAKIGNYVDTIEYDVENDKVYKNEVINKKIIDGTEGWQDSGITSVAYTNIITDYATSNNIPYCTHFKGENNCNGAGGMQDYGDNSIAFMQVSGSITPRLYIKKIGMTTTQLRTLLAEIKPILYYALETEVKEEITGTLKDQVKALYNSHSFNGTTIITSNGDLPMIIKVRGLKGE